MGFRHDHVAFHDLFAAFDIDLDVSLDHSPTHSSCHWTETHHHTCPLAHALGPLGGGTTGTGAETTGEIDTSASRRCPLRRGETGTDGAGTTATIRLRAKGSVRGIGSGTMRGLELYVHLTSSADRLGGKGKISRKAKLCKLWSPGQRV